MGFGKDGKGVIIRDQNVITLGTLAADAVVKQTGPLALTEDFRMLKSEHWVTIQNATKVEADGPLIYGLANDELSVAEIAECLNVNGPLDPSDRGNQEQAERAVFPIAIIDFVEGTAREEHFNDGKPYMHKKPWTYSKAAGFTTFAYNMGSGALTTGGQIRFNNIYYGVWVR